MTFKEYKEMKDTPFLYWTGLVLGVFREFSLILGIIFVILYACDKIDWSLWLVTLPFWYFLPVTLIAMVCDTILYLIRTKKRVN